MDQKRIREKHKILGVRKFIASKMAESLRDYPQGTGCTKLCMDELIKVKDDLKSFNSNVTITTVLIKLIAEALKEHREINSAIIEDELVIYESINIGIGVGLDDGIRMVVVKEVQDKDIYEVSDELKDMVVKLKNKKLSMEHMMGSTFTISNLGMFDMDEITAFLNPPETGILAIGTTRKELVVNDDDTTRIEQRATFSITINHAAIDGLHGAQFILTLKELLKNPINHMGLK